MKFVTSFELFFRFWCCFSLLPEHFLKNDFGHLTVPFLMAISK